MTPDEQEAHSLKYVNAIAVMPLSSGRFAIFAPFDQRDGLPLLEICEPSALVDAVSRSGQQAQERWQREKDSTPFHPPQPRPSADLLADI